MKRISRRNAIKGLGVTGAVGLAGCVSDISDLTGGSTEEESPLPGPEEWGERLNEHAEQADIDWRQFEGTELKFGMGLHKYSIVTQEVLPAFEELTGISVEYDIFPEDEYWLEARDDLNPGGEGEYDGVMAGLWQVAELHNPDDQDEPVVHDLNKYINDPDLTDQDWLAMDDFLDQTIELMTFPNNRDGEQGDLVGFPNGVEAYGAVACDNETFETIDELADDPGDEIETFDDLENAARIISESDQTEREGITSRTSTTTLSSANWATMFRTHGAEWIDRSVLAEDEPREARVASEEGIRSLERFGTMMRDYGPEDPGQNDWYRANDALSVGETAMIYTTPSTSGVISEEQFQNTTWIPPLPGPDGEDPTVATWVWSTGISQRSDNPEAAWLFIQWANSRLGNYMLSTRQWEGHAPRAGTARLNFVEDMIRDDGRSDIVGMPEEVPPWEQIGMSESWITAHREGMNNVPSNPPPVPVDTPQNMPIMTEAARAMNEVVRGVHDAETALTGVEEQITEYASQIPDEYLVNR